MAVTGQPRCAAPLLRRDIRFWRDDSAMVPGSRPCGSGASACLAGGDGFVGLMFIGFGGPELRPTCVGVGGSEPAIEEACDCGWTNW